MKPQISIILPSYNYERYITKAIDSIISQTFTNWELIVIDDGSKDESVNLIKQYKDKRVILLTQKNSGVSKTLNRGLRISQGQYICLLDADDKFHKEKLQDQINLLKSGYDIVTSKVEAINENGLTLPDDSFNQTWNSFNPSDIYGKEVISKFIEKNYLCKSSVMIRKSLFKKYGLFNESLITAYDLDLWLRFLQSAKIARHEKVLTYYRWHGENETTTNNPRIRIELLLVLDKFLEHQLKGSSEEQYKKYSNSLRSCIEGNNLLNAYITLQFIKSNNKLDDIYKLLSSKKMYTLLIDSLEDR